MDDASRACGVSAKGKKVEQSGVASRGEERGTGRLMSGASLAAAQASERGWLAHARVAGRARGAGPASEGQRWRAWLAIWASAGQNGSGLDWAAKRKQAGWGHAGVGCIWVSRPLWP